MFNKDGKEQYFLLLNLTFICQAHRKRQHNKELTKRNYMSWSVRANINFVNYANKNFDKTTSAALDDILEKGKKYNKTKKQAAENTELQI